MKDKEKSKEHPFREVLRPGEEILWFYQFRLERRLTKGEIGSLLGFPLLLFGCAFLIAMAVPTHNQLTIPTAYQIEGFVTLFFGCGGPAILLMLFLFLCDLSQDPLGGYIDNYAITNQRILSRIVGKRVGDETQAYEHFDIKKILIHPDMDGRPRSAGYTLTHHSRSYLWWSRLGEDGEGFLDAIKRTEAPFAFGVVPSVSKATTSSAVEISHERKREE